MLLTTFQDDVPEAGCDEAGRGCLAGPVFAAAVVLPAGFAHPLLDDSKKMSARNRELVRVVIERDAVAWAVASVGPARIDEINILNASFEAMNMAVAALGITPGLLLVDGNRFRTESAIEWKCIVGGDGLYANIAAASVLAKTHRDEYMRALAAEFPEYGWERNMGYPTAEHRQAIVRQGITEQHRKTFCAGRKKS